MIQKIITYRTSDGREFSDEAEAQTHERATALTDAIAAVLEADGYSTRHINGVRRALMRQASMLVERLGT